MSLVGSEDACSDNSLISLRAGTPQFDEEQQQICARLRIYIKYQYSSCHAGLLQGCYVVVHNMCYVLLHNSPEEVLHGRTNIGI